MTEHLWKTHGLILEGQRVREPWRVIEDWVDEYRANRNPSIWERAEELAQRLDPADGVRRFQRMLLARDIGDSETRRELLREATERQASLCPNCYEFVPLPDEIQPAEISAWYGRLSGAGYSVEVDDAGLFSRLVIRGPSGIIVNGPEPGHVVSVKGRLFLFAGLPIYTALLTSCLLPILLVCVLLGLGLVLWWFFRIERQGPAQRRVLAHAWSELAPLLLVEDAPLDALRFMTGLVKLCEEQRYLDAPRDLARIAKGRVETLVDEGQPAAALLAPLQRYLIAGAAATGRDAVPLLVEQLARCFRNELPFSYAQNLLAGVPSGLSGKLEQRLRVLLCKSAFDAGFEVRNVLEACQVAPALDAIFHTSDVRYLAMLRLVHSMAKQAAWEKLGGRTAFEVATEATHAELLLDFPQLMLLYEDRSIMMLDRITRTPGPARVALCSDGVRFGDAIASALPHEVELRRPVAMGVYELRWNGLNFDFTSDPAELTARLERWVRFYVQDFKPQSSDVLRWQSATGATALEPKSLVECPECHRKVFPRAGDVAVPLEVGRLISV